MSTAVIDIERTFSQAESYNVDLEKEQKLSFFEKLLHWYADSLHSYYETIRNTNYSPFSITPKDAVKYLKTAERNRNQFSSLAKMFQQIKDDDELIEDIYEHQIKIANEFEIAIEYLEQLSDPSKHAKIKESIGSMYSSNFLED